MAHSDTVFFTIFSKATFLATYCLICYIYSVNFISFNIKEFVKKTTVCLVVFVFLVSQLLVLLPTQALAQIVTPAQTGFLSLPLVGTKLAVSPAFTPIILRGIQINPDNPFQFDFIVDSGDTGLEGDALKDEAKKAIKYFLASLTIPEGELWVNLSPYEKDRIIPEVFGQTEMGRDILAQDYILKQFTASLLDPTTELGESFWQRVYEKAQMHYGVTDIPVNTFNKVWILPQRAEILQQNNTALVVDSYLKVMLEEDYLALRNSVGTGLASVKNDTDDMQEAVRASSTEILRKIIIPAIEKEVNEGEHFVVLRQIYHSLILATWFKKTLKNSILAKVYIDQKKIAGVDVTDINIKDKIYAQYLEAFKKGVYDIIQEEYDSAKQELIPRKYFSGGIQWTVNDMAMIAASPDNLTARGQRGFADLQDRTDKLSFVRALFSATKKELQKSFESIKGAVLKPVFAAALAAAIFIPTLSPAVTPDSLNLIRADTQYYNQTVLSQITTRNIDHNLNQMTQQYKNEQGGFIPTHLNLGQLEEVFNRLNLNNANSFEEIAQGLRTEFSSYYKKRKAGRLTRSERGVLEDLELQTTQWIMDFLLTTTKYDHVGAQKNDDRVEALYRLFLGKKTADGDPKMHVCSSISEAAVILGVGEFGMRTDALRVHNVFEDFDGNKYPDKNGIGHVILGHLSISGQRHLFDQSNTPMVRQHKLINPGETLSQVTEEQEARAEYNNLISDYKKFIKQMNLQGDERVDTNRLAYIQKQIAPLLKNSALVRHADLRTNALNLDKVVRSSLKNGQDFQLVNDFMIDIQEEMKDARSAFDQGDWGEAERLYYLLAQKIDKQVDFLTPVLTGIKGIVDERGRPLDGRSLISNLRASAAVCIKNAEAANNNYIVKVEQKEFAEYKKYETRFNSLGQNVSSSDEEKGAAVINQLKILKDKVRAQVNNRNLQTKTRFYYEDLLTSVNTRIDNLSAFFAQADANKRFVNRYNSLVGEKRISSNEAPGIIKELEKLRVTINDYLRNNKVSRENRASHISLVSNIDEMIAQLAGMGGQKQRRSTQIVQKTSQGNAADQYNALVVEFNSFGGRSYATSTQEGKSEILRVIDQLRNLKIRAKKNNNALRGSADLQSAYSGLISSIDASIEQMNGFVQQQNNVEQQFQEYKALENELNQLVGNRSISSNEFPAIRKKLRLIKLEVKKMMLIQGLDAQIESLYRKLIIQIDGLLRQLAYKTDSNKGEAGVHVAQLEPINQANVDAAMSIDAAWNKGGIDLNYLEIGIQGDEIKFTAPSIPEGDFGLPENFSGFSTQIISVNPITNFQAIF
ncbi:hypothetical protein ACFL49_00100 [Candidatus Omnitrophota bacterium]